LIGVYLYLDLRKIKLQIESLDKNNDMFAKEFDKINTGFNVMHKKISHIVAPEEFKKVSKESKGKANISEPVRGKEVTNIDPKEANTDINGSKEDAPSSKIYDVKLNPDEEIKDLVSQIDNSVDNITGKINNPNTIIDDKNDIDVNILDLDDEVHDIDIDIDELDSGDDDEDDDCIDGLEGLNGIENQENQENQENIFHDINMYLNMSVKELKEKCIELGLKHSGNKQSLAQRIIDKLG